MSEPIQQDVILRLDDVSKVYSGIVAVKRANLELRSTCWSARTVPASRR
jgi:erythritol transport system ATP-binding protein